MVTRIVFLGLGALVLSFIAVGLLRTLAERHSVVALPNERSAHFHPTPVGGGLPIVLITLSGLVILWTFNSSWSGPALTAYVVGSLLVAIVGFVDDLRNLGRWSRAISQLTSAVLLVSAFGFWEKLSLPLIGQLEFGWLGLPLTLFWVLGLLNAYNFMDGVDGLAGSQAVIAGLAWGGVGLFSGQYLVAGLGVLIAASSLGFLCHNWAPARIFMGDAGSVFLGYTFAALPLIATGPRWRFPLFGFLVLWPFIFDSSFTMVRRLRRGEPVWTAHRSHLYQRLLPLGYSHQFLSSLYAALAMIGVGLASMWLKGAPGAPFWIWVGLPLVALGLWLFVVRQEQKYGRPGGPQLASLVGVVR